MRELNDLERTFVNLLARKYVGETISLESILARHVFSMASQKRLILQPKGRFAVFFSSPGDPAIGRAVSQLLSLLSFLASLNRDGYISLFKPPLGENTRLVCIGEDFEPPRIEADRIILNRAGLFTDRPGVIKNAEGDVVFEGVQLSGDNYDLIYNNAIGQFFVSEKIRILFQPDDENALSAPQPESSTKRQSSKTPGKKHRRAKTAASNPERKTFLKSVFGRGLVIICCLLLAGISGVAVYSLSSNNNAFLTWTGQHQAASTLNEPNSTSSSDAADQEHVLTNASATDQSTRVETCQEPGQLRNGIDISEFQGDIDWEKIEPEAVNFVIIRASSGLHSDANFNENWAGAKRQCLPRTLYHFFSERHSAKEQADLFISKIRETGDPEFVFAPIVDIEAKSASEKFCDNPVEAAEFADSVSTFLEHVEAAIGVRMMIYTSAGFFDCLPTRENLPGGRSLWVANYTQRSTPHMPLAWSDWLVWQHSDEEQIDGIAEPVDGNRTNSNLSPTAVYLQRLEP